MNRQQTGNSGASASAPLASGGARSDAETLGSEIAEACEELDERTLRALLERAGGAEGADGRSAALEFVDERGRTPLGVAARAGDLKLVRMLLEAGSDPNASSPAEPAAGLGSPEARRIAARNGVDLRTPLTCAVESGELELVEFLLAAGASPYTGGATNPLELSVLLGDAEIVRTLLDAGADPNARDSEGDTPLMIAAAAGLSEPIEALLEYGAIAPAKNDDGDTALRIAARAGRRDAFALLAPHFSFFERLMARTVRSIGARASRRPRASVLARTERFHEDALHGRLASVRKALAAGVSADRRFSEDGDTALALAAEGGHANVVRALLEGGADPNLYAKRDTPITRALGPRALDRRATHDVVRALVFGGGDLEMRDGDGLTPLMRAVVDGGGDLRIVTTLVDLGADLKATHPAGLTALDLALHDPAKADLAARLEAWIEKRDDVQQSSGQTQQTVEELRGLGETGGSCVVLAVRASIDRVAPELEQQRGGRQWNRDVYADDGWFAGAEGYVVYRLRGHSWTLAQSALVDERALHPRDARTLSKALDCDALLFETCEASGILRYALYSGGTRVEEFGVRDDGRVAFESALGSDLLEGDTALAQLESRFEAWGLFVPGIADDRIDWLTRRFSAREFERVDFLRIDSEAPAETAGAVDFGEDDLNSSLD